MAENTPQVDHLSDEDLDQFYTQRVAPKASNPLEEHLGSLGDDDVHKVYEKIYQQKTAPQAEPTTEFRSAMRGALQGGTMGFADELTGAGQAAYDKLTGDEKSLLDLYRQHRDESREAFAKAEKDNPKSYTTGQVGGSIATFLLPWLKGAGVASRLGIAAAGGGAAGLGNSGADLTKGEVGQAAKDTGIGAGIGAAGGAVAEAAAPLMSKVGAALGTKAEALAEKATGATRRQLEDFKPGTGRELLDRKVVKLWATPANVAHNAQAQMDKAGQAISDTLDALDETGVHVSSPEIKKAVEEKLEKLGSMGGDRAAMRQGEGYLNDLLEAIGDDSTSGLTPSQLEAQKRSYSKVNWSDPEKGLGKKTVYRALRDLTEETASAANPDLNKTFIENKKLYGLLDPVQEAAEKRGMQLQQHPAGGFLDMEAMAAAAHTGKLGAVIAAPIIRTVTAPFLPSTGAVAANVAGKLLNSKDAQLFARELVNGLARTTSGKLAAPDEHHDALRALIRMSSANSVDRAKALDLLNRKGQIDVQELHRLISEDPEKDEESGQP